MSVYHLFIGIIRYHLDRLYEFTTVFFSFSSILEKGPSSGTVNQCIVSIAVTGTRPSAKVKSRMKQSKVVS